MSKKGFFSAFHEERMNKKEEEEVVRFRFNREADGKGSIKKHFTVEKRVGKAEREKETEKKVKMNEKKDNTRESVQNVKKSTLDNSNKSSNKRTFFRVFRAESNSQGVDDDDSDEEEEEVTRRFKFNSNTEEDREVEKKKRKTNSVVVSPRQSSHVKISRREEDEVKNSNKSAKDNVPTRTSPRKSLAKNKRSIAKMMSMSQSYEATEDNVSPAKSTKPAAKKSEKKKGRKKDKGLTKIDTHFKRISIDDLLKLPETVGDTGLTMDEILDKVDEEIKEHQAKHEAEMKMLDQTLEKQREKAAVLDRRMEANALLRDRLAEELTRDKLVELFEENVSYLTDIREGKIESERHKLFHQNSQSRQSLLYRMITHPFTDEQVDWTYEEFRRRWMKTTKQFHQFNEYMWKVLLPECFIKFYMDIFKFTKEETEIRIKETPMIDD